MQKEHDSVLLLGMETRLHFWPSLRGCAFKLQGSLPNKHLQQYVFKKILLCVFIFYELKHFLKLLPWLRRRLGFKRLCSLWSERIGLFHLICDFIYVRGRMIHGPGTLLRGQKWLIFILELSLNCTVALNKSWALQASVLLSMKWQSNHFPTYSTNPPFPIAIIYERWPFYSWNDPMS